MNMSNIEFKEKVVVALRLMKFDWSPQANELTIPIRQQQSVVGRLRPVHAWFTPEEVKLLTQWRNENREAFLTWFTTTQEGTTRWLREQILGQDDRILFFVETPDGVPFGHVGLTNFDFCLKACEIDNVLRGKQDLSKGGMTYALRALIGWVFCSLNANFIYLRVFDHNERAVKLYMRSGFQIVRRVPLQRVEEENKVRWVEVGENHKGTFEKYLAYLQIERSDYERAE